MSPYETPSTEGGLKHKALEFMKLVAYRTPVLNSFSRPRYTYNLEPAQLSWLVEAIDRSRANKQPGTIVEVGVARGMTTTYLLEHMKLSGDNRTYVCLDSFEGFIDSDVDYEVEIRRKNRSDYGGFKYSDINVFKMNLARSGYSNVYAHKGDASGFDFSSISPVDVVLLDVDLYVPTRNVLRNVWDFLNENALVMVDDCAPDSVYDGAYSAYLDFCTEREVPTLVVGNKGGIIVKSSDDPKPLSQTAQR